MLPIVALAALLLIQWWTASAGTFRLWLPDREFRYTTGYTGQLADSLRHGRLDLRATPPEGLAALTNPFDPDQRFLFNPMLDASYVGGHYYLYFGPTPALFAAALFPGDVRDLPDSVPTLAFAALLTTAGGVALWRIRALVLPAAPMWPWLAAAAVFALANPTLYTLARPAVYEVAIVAGQALLIAGLVCALFGQRHWGWWLAAGVCWALAIGARLTLAPGVALLALGVLWVDGTRKAALSRLVAAGVPLLLGLALLGWYNAARFGSPLETGHRYQLAGFDLNAKYDRFFGMQYLIPNAYLFLLQPTQRLAGFPFLQAVAPAAADIPGGVPDELRIEPTAGLLMSAPFLLFALAAPLARGRARRLGIVLLLGAVVAAGPDLLQRYATMRYLLDFAPLACLAAFIGAAALWERAPAWRLVTGVTAVALALASVAMGIGLGLSGRYEHLERHNPALFARLNGHDPAQPLTVPARLDNPAADIVLSPLDAKFGGTLEVSGFRFEPEAANPGDPAWLVLWWRPLRDEPVVAKLKLVTAIFRTVVDDTIPIAPGVVGEWQKTRIPIRLPADTPAPEYLQAELGFAAARAPDALLPLSGAGERRSGERITFGPLHVLTTGPWPPADAEPRDLRFGNDMVLAGVRTAAHPGVLTVAAYWRASWSGGLRWSDRQITFELVNPAGTVVLTDTIDPGEGWYRTSQWQPGDQIIDERDLRLPPNLPPGDYEVRVRVTWDKGEVPPIGDPTIATVHLQ